MSRYFRNDLDAFAYDANLSFEGSLAVDLLKGWFSVAAEADGEDSMGRQKMKLQQVETMVARAVSAAEIMTKTFEDKGWIKESISIESAAEMKATYEGLIHSATFKTRKSLIQEQSKAFSDE